MNKIRKLLAGAVCTAVMAGLVTAIPANAMTGFPYKQPYDYDTTKDLAYYASLTDEEVFNEYNQSLPEGFRKNDTASSPEDLPSSIFVHFVNWMEYIENTRTQGLRQGDYFSLEFEVIIRDEITQEEMDALLNKNDPSVWGLSEDWTNSCVDSGEKVYSSQLAVYDFPVTQYVLAFRDAEQIPENEADLLRYVMALGNSPFIAGHNGQVELMSLYGGSSMSAEDPAEAVFGDINGDGRVNANDAACILRYSAAYGAKNFTGTLEEFMQQ